MMQPQIWITVIAILGVAAVALLVDYLRTKNQQLAEAMVELRFRRAQDQPRVASGPTAPVVEIGEQRSHPKTSKAPERDDEQERFIASAAQAAAARIASEEAALTAPEASSSEEPVEQASRQPVKSVEELVRKPEPGERNNEARLRNLAMRQAEDRAVEFASRHGRRRISNPPPAELPRLENMNPKEALAEWLNKRALARFTPAQPAAPAVEPVVPAAAQAPDVVPPIEVTAPVFESEAIVTSAPEPEPVMTIPAPVPSQSSVFVDESLLEALFGEPSAKKPVPQPRFEVIQGAAGIPTGMHDESVLNRLLDANKPFTGLVVSINVNQTNGNAPSRDMMLAVNQFVRGLLRDDDFGCQLGGDEFVLLCPGVEAAAAQPRLSEISERLWDFQLRGAGSFSLLFGWGDVHVNGEALNEAIASATERMQQTRRARKTVSLDSASPRRKVIAAV